MDERLTYADGARIAGTGLISTGLALLVFVAITLAWGDPFTRWQEQGAQNKLAHQLRMEDAQAGTTSSGQSSTTPDPRLTRAAAYRFRKSLHEGDAAGRLTIPRIHLQKVVVKGAGPDQLSKGPGIYDEASFPGSGLPVAIAGHRTTHGAPFLNVDQLRPGDLIRIDMPYGQFDYRVSKTRIIEPNDWSILQLGAAETNARLARQMRDDGICPNHDCEHLVLTACHPKYSASHRIAVLARLVSVRLRGQGL